MSLKEVEEKAEEINKILRCDYPGFGGIVHIVHEDGTSLLYKNAFMVTYKGCVIVFSEHNGIYVNSTDDLMLYENMNAKTESLDENKIILWNERSKIYEKIFNSFIKEEFPTNNYGYSVSDVNGNIFSSLIANSCEVTKKKWRYSVEFKENSTEIKEKKYEETGSS